MVSIIIPTFNSSNTLRFALESVKNQTSQSWECIVIDAVSKDNTLDIVQQYAIDDTRFSFVSEKDNGIFDAMNKGLLFSTGEWIIYLGSDDSLEVCAVENLLNAGINADIVYGNTYLKFNSGVEKKHFSKNHTDLSKKMIACHQSIMMKKNVIVNLGGFDTTFHFAADYDLTLRAFMKNYKFNKTDDFISHFSLNGVSSDNLDIIYEILQIHKKNKSLRYPILYFVISYLRQIAVILKHKYIN